MIYFKSIATLRSFIHNNLINKKKSVFNFMDLDKQKLFINHSLAYFHTEDDIVEELKKQGYIYTYKREINHFPLELEDSGFIFLYSKFKTDITQQDILSETIKNDRLLTINQVADFLSVSRQTVYNKINEGVIPVVDLFGQKRIQLSDILDYIKKHKNR